MVVRPNSSLTLTLALVAAIALVAGCSSGGGGGTNSTAPAGGGGTSAGTSGFTQGVITGFGTIHLGSGADEHVFHVENAILKRVDDDLESDRHNDDTVMFRLGMKVQVFHDDSTHAREVRFKDDLEGPITAKPSAHAGATFDVLGVPVLVDGNTHFDDSFEGTGLTLGSLTVGNVIELSGDFDANGVLHATFIEARGASGGGGAFEIKGDISNLSGSIPNQTFTVNGVTFTMNSSSQVHDLSVGLSNGLGVEVKTQSTSAPFIVTRIEGLAGDFDEAENEVRGADEASVEGFIRNLTGSSPTFSFTISGTRVTTSATTVGLGLVVANAHVEAEGPVGSTGEIKARKISARP